MSEQINSQDYRPAPIASFGDLAIAQFLALARTANVTFHLVDGRLAMRLARADKKLWPTVRLYLDEIGIDAIEAYFHRFDEAQRERLSAAA